MRNDNTTQSPFPSRACLFLFTAGLVAIFTMTGFTYRAIAGPYKVSAHGNTTVGVSRGDITAAGYSRGNCAHCHEKHASIEGDEPDPADGSPSAFMLFTENFDTSVTGFPYTEADNICFSCHNEAGSIMQVTNYTYAQTFGGYTPNNQVNSIFNAFSLALKEGHTEHNLKDVYNYANSHFDYFTDSSNPCAACHNPHLAKRNHTDPDNPALTAISRPTDHDNLWGDSAGETMADSVGSNTYQPPYYWNSTTTYEPDNIALHDGSKMPDYNTFCLDCHGNADVYSSVYSRNLKQIDWSATGDIHGGRSRSGDQYSTVTGYTLKVPYQETTSTSPNYVLSCVDCHEPHGTIMYNFSGYYSFLLRKEVNGGEVGCWGCGWSLNDADWTVMDVCNKCHVNGSDGDDLSHCGSQWECMGCHFHGSIQAAGCGPSDWNKEAF